MQAELLQPLLLQTCTPHLPVFREMFRSTEPFWRAASFHGKLANVGITKAALSQSAHFVLGVFPPRGIVEEHVVCPLSVLVLLQSPTCGGHSGVNWACPKFQLSLLTFTAPPPMHFLVTLVTAAKLYGKQPAADDAPNKSSDPRSRRRGLSPVEGGHARAVRA